MNKNQKILLKSFRALTEKQRARLREHARRKTPIACGKLSGFFFINGHG
jgi:hypothetical protein